jgi:hypothetical protein
MRRSTLLIAMLVVVVVLLLSPAASALGTAGWSNGPTAIATGGIGDEPISWQNSYPWSMTMFNGDLYVGTGRLGCTSAVMSLMSGPMAGGGGVAMPGGTPPPKLSEFLNADRKSVSDGAKFEAFNAASRAEIWRYHLGAWQRVFQAPLIDSYMMKPPQAGQAQPMPYQAAAITGFRGMAVLTDKTGRRTLYAAAGGFTFAAKQPLLMCSTDGLTWTPVYAPAEVGRESRALYAHHGKLYVGVGYSGLGAPVAAGAWASGEPTDPKSWTKVIDFPSLDETNTNVVSFATFAGHLYAGTENKTGYQVWRSTAVDPMGNEDWKQVVTGGAGVAMNEWAGTMRVFDGRLYVGSMHVPGVSGSTEVKGFDLIRISARDTWELVIGTTRTAVTSRGARTMTPASGQPSGMGNPLNLYCWSLAVQNGRLYLGTFDLTTMLKFADPSGQQIAAMLKLPLEQVQALFATAGADLYVTRDGDSWQTITKTGFGNQFDYGFRNTVATPSGLYFGMSNPFYGCELWRARTHR